MPQEKKKKRKKRRDQPVHFSLSHPIAGSIMAVTMADKHAPGKESRFVGICIHRGGSGLRANFTLRNVIDGQGEEYMNILPHAAMGE